MQPSLRGQVSAQAEGKESVWPGKDEDWLRVDKVNRWQINEEIGLDMNRQEREDRHMD